MHTGEEWFSVPWQGYLAMGLLLAVYLILTYTNRLPSMAAFKDFADTINSAGGHIILLFLLTLLSIKVSMQLFYHLLGLPAESISKSEAVVTSAMTYATGMLTGQFVGALLKTMSGGKANGTAPVSPAAAPDTLQVALTPEKEAKP